jgi:hypothetical protein
MFAAAQNSPIAKSNDRESMTLRSSRQQRWLGIADRDTPDESSQHKNAKIAS